MSVNPHQYPREGEVFLDHVAIFADEFVRSGQALERLGFTLTPFRAHTSALRPGEPMTPLGTGNRSAMLRSGYIELLGPTADTPMAAHLRQEMARYAGLHLIAFTGHGVEAHYAALEADGLAPLPIAKIERTQATPQGEEFVRARIVRLPQETWPEGRVQMIFPEMSADTVWHPDLVVHANAADRLSEMLLVVEDPAARAARMGRFARRPVRAAGRRHVVETDRGRIHFIPPEDARRYLPGLRVPTVPYMAAVALGSADMARTRDFFASRAVARCEHAGTLQIAPAECLGATLVFHGRGDDKVFDSIDAQGPDA